MKGKVIQSIFIILILLIGLFQILPNNSIAVGNPVVHLQFNEGEEVQQANVRPGESGEVSFHGTVSADIPAGGAVQDVQVYLRAATNQGWPTTITPAVIMLQLGTEEAPFIATVKVPIETSYGTESIIIIDGTAETFPGSSTSEVPPLAGTIKIAQYYRFALDCDAPTLKTTSGSDVTFELIIRNEGNGRDRFSIEVNNLDELTRKGFEIELSRSMIEIPEKGEQTVEITIKVPDGSKGVGKNNIELKVCSELEPLGQRIYQRYTLTLKVSEDNIFLSTDFWYIIIVIIILTVCIIIFWKYKKSKRELMEQVKK